MNGTSSAPGSRSHAHARMCSINSERSEEWLPTTRSVKSTRKPSSPSTSAIPSRTSASPSPGGTRQSILSSARLGITFTFSDALMRVGVKVTPSIGSNMTARRGSAARRWAIAPAGSSGSSPRPRSSSRATPVSL